MLGSTSEAGSETRPGLCCRGPNAACGDAASLSSVNICLLVCFFLSQVEVGDSGNVYQRSS